MECVFIFGNDSLWCVDDHETLDHRCDLEVKGQTEMLEICPVTHNGTVYEGG